MRNLLLSVALIAVPVGVFAAVESVLPHSPQGQAQGQGQDASGLGDLSRYQTIVADTRTIAATGDFTAAETRVSDFETLWDKEASTLRAKDKAAWGSVDDAADAVFSALRAKTPKAAEVNDTLAALTTTLQQPAQAAAPGGGVTMVQGVAVTDDSGRPLPCEEMLASVRAATAQVSDPAKTSQATTLATKATERCNADDDRTADSFSAQALAVLKS